MEPGVADGRVVVCTIWGFTAHSDGLTGSSLKGVEGEERGVATMEEVLGVAGSDGVSGRESSGEGEEEDEEVRGIGIGRGRGGGGGGFVRASNSAPCRGKARGLQQRTRGAWWEGGSEGETGNVARRAFPGGHQDGEP